MNKLLLLLLYMAAALFAVPAAAQTAKEGKESGKALFERHCEACHANGGNTMNPAKTLKKKDLHANGIRTREDIVKVMRKPGPGMTPFDTKTMGEQEARAIADYVLKTFK